jgi:trimethylamine:corrinoid methyltransferase-like protein
VVEGARLFDALGACGPVHVHVAAMDPRTAQVEIARLCCENSRAVGNWAPAFSYDQAMCVRDMYAAAGRPEPWVALQMTHSPMRLDAYYLDILLRARSSPGGTRGITAGGGAMPQPGVSSPVYWRAAAAQGLAEALGAWVTVKLIDPTVRPYASFTTSVTDMTNCAAWSRAPESMAFALLTRQVMRELLGTVEGEYIAPRQEEPARGRCMGELYLWALQGARIFGGAGLRRGAFSAPHVVIDREKLAYLEAAVAGVEFPQEPRLAARIMAENLPETSFLMHETTLRFREIHWEPVMFKGMAPPVLAGLLCDDSDELLPRARELAKDLAESNPFRLDDAAAREVGRIYERGMRALTGG